MVKAEEPHEAQSAEHRRLAEGSPDTPGDWSCFGENFKVELPRGSGIWATLGEVAIDFQRRLLRLFLLDRDGRRPAQGANPRFLNDPAWRDSLLFYEYFHGDTGEGLGASHQTGWTALVGSQMAHRARFRA